MHDCSGTRKLKWRELELGFIKIIIGYVVLGKIHLYHSDRKIMLLQFKLTGDWEEHFTTPPSSTKLFAGGGAGQGCSRNC